MTKDLQSKYNFDLSNKIKENNSLKPNISKPLDENLKMQTENYNIQIEMDKTNIDKIEKIKIKEDSKTYYQKLKRKIILNKSLAKLFIGNFYNDEFNYSRKSSYLIFGFPASVIISFYIFRPNHPLIGIITSISIISSFATFYYFFLSDIKNISESKDSQLGNKIRMIKNELVLYNPLSKPIILEDENKK